MVIARTNSYGQWETVRITDYFGQPREQTVVSSNLTHLVERIVEDRKKGAR